MSNIYKSGEDFLNKKYKELFFSDIVESIKENSDTRDEALRKYLKLLEETHNNVYSKKSDLGRNLLKKTYYSKYIIKPEDITENYWNFLNQQYITEIGYELNEELKQKHIETIIKDQKASLDAWIDYLSCDDSKFYPMWAKYWAFQGMLTIGTYDNKNKIYKKRTKDTVAPFIELNQEVLAKCIDYIVKYVELNQINEDDLEKLITSGNFFKLYTVLLEKFKEVTYDKESIDGVWKKYEQGDNYLELYNSLQGYATGWCTAGEDTCKSQVRDGDFYVYYTYDKEGKPKIPRIAIRMDGKNRIGEIRGVAKDQNLESHLEDVLEEKLKEFPDRDSYKQRIEDQKQLTLIYDKYKNNIELSKDDLEFLYEIKRNISKFGYEDDPRKKEILEKRKEKKDYAYIFGCKEKEVIKNPTLYRMNPKKYKILLNNLDINEKDPKKIILPKVLIGRLNFSNLKDARGLILPKVLKGALLFNELENANGLILKNYKNLHLYLYSIKNTEGMVLELDDWYTGVINLSNIKSAEGLNLPKKYISYLSLDGLESAKHLKLPENIGSLHLNGLTNPKDLILPKTILGGLYLDGLKTAENLEFPDNIGEDLELNGLKTTKGLKLPKNIGGYLSLDNLTSAENLNLINIKFLSLSLCGLKSGKGLVLPNRIEGNLYLSNIVTAEDLSLPEYVGDTLYLDNLKSANGLKLPSSVEGLSLINLTNCKDLILPEKHLGTLYLDGLVSGEGLIINDKITKRIILNNLKSAKGIIFSDNIQCDLYMPSLKTSEGLELPENFDLNKLECPEHIKQELIERRNKKTR